MNERPGCPDCGELAAFKKCLSCDGKGAGSFNEPCASCFGLGGRYFCEFCLELQQQAGRE